MPRGGGTPRGLAPRVGRPSGDRRVGLPRGRWLPPLTRGPPPRGGGGGPSNRAEGDRMTPLEADFDSLREGDRFVTRGRTVTESDLVGFATLTGDAHPQHTDAVWAASSPFGERIAHGLLVL